MRAEQGPCEPIKGCIREGQSMPESGSESQLEPEWESQRSSKSQREPVKAWESKLEPEGARVGVTESHREPERDSKSQREPVKAWESHLEPEGTRGS